MTLNLRCAQFRPASSLGLGVLSVVLGIALFFGWPMAWLGGSAAAAWAVYDRLA